MTVVTRTRWHWWRVALAFGVWLLMVVGFWLAHVPLWVVIPISMLYGWRAQKSFDMYHFEVSVYYDD